MTDKEQPMTDRNEEVEALFARLAELGIDVRPIPAPEPAPTVAAASLQPGDVVNGRSIAAIDTDDGIVLYYAMQARFVVGAPAPEFGHVVAAIDCGSDAATVAMWTGRSVFAADAELPADSVVRKGA